MERHDKVLSRVWLVFAVLVLVLTLAIRIRLLGIPLERDEGEYAYAGQLMLQGISPYKLAYNMKFPGTSAAYALIMSIFGQTIVGIHLGLLLVNLATVALIFFLGRRLINATAGIAAATSYAILSVNPSVLGLAGHATNFVVLPVMGGLLLLLDRSERRESTRLFTSGLLFGLGLLMKQPALFFALFGSVWLLFRGIRSRSGLKKITLQNLTFGAGAVLPLGIACLFLWWSGTFSQFWFWSVSYAVQYGGLTTLSKGAHNLVHTGTSVIESGGLLWALAGFGLLAGLFNRARRAATGFLLGLFAFSALALSPGLYFRDHYFILALPAIALLGGVAMSRLEDLAVPRGRVARFIPVLLLGAALGLSLFQQRKIFFQASPVEACRMIYLENPFPESVKIAEYVGRHTNPEDTIAVVGSEPQIYFYAKRHSATGYIYMYSLTEEQPYVLQMQREMFREISLARPKYLIFVAIPYSWLWAPRYQQSIFSWVNEFAEQDYTLVGMVNIVSPDRTDYYLDGLPQSMPPLKNCVSIYQRKS